MESLLADARFALRQFRRMPVAAMEAEDKTAMVQASGAAAAGGLLALLLSAIALYAVVAFTVGQRTREIGIRTALGARRSQVVSLFFTRGIRLSVFGILAGLPLSLIALRIVAALGGAPRTSTPVLAAMIVASVMGVAALATWIPARRAAAVDPLTALRSE